MESKVLKDGYGTGHIIQINVDIGTEARVYVVWDDPSINGSNIIGGWYSPNELEFLKVITSIDRVSDTNSEEYLKRALNILKEFVTDIENRGLEIIGEDWPELLTTYQHAVKVLS